MIVLDPETQVAIQDNGNVIYNCWNTDLCKIDPNVLTCEWCDDNPGHNNLLLLAELFFNRKYPRFTDFYRAVVGQETVYLREWEKDRLTLKDSNFDQHQRVGKARAVTMQMAFNKFMPMLNDPKIIKLSAGLSRARLAKSHEVDLKVTYKCKEQIFEIYKEKTKLTDYAMINSIAVKQLTENGFVQNLHGRKIFQSHVQDNDILGALIQFSIQDTATIAADYLSQILAPHNGVASPGCQCVNVLLGSGSNVVGYKESIIAAIKNPDNILDRELDVIES